MKNKDAQVLESLGMLVQIFEYLWYFRLMLHDELLWSICLNDITQASIT